MKFFLKKSFISTHIPSIAGRFFYRHRPSSRAQREISHPAAARLIAHRPVRIGIERPALLNLSRIAVQMG
jgi:hypothetical protein